MLRAQHAKGNSVSTGLAVWLVGLPLLIAFGSIYYTVGVVIWVGCLLATKLWCKIKGKEANYKNVMNPNDMLDLTMKYVVKWLLPVVRPLLHIAAVIIIFCTVVLPTLIIASVIFYTLGTIGYGLRVAGTITSQIRNKEKLDVENILGPHAALMYTLKFVIKPMVHCLKVLIDMCPVGQKVHPEKRPTADLKPGSKPVLRKVPQISKSMISSPIDKYKPLPSTPPPPRARAGSSSSNDNAKSNNSTGCWSFALS
jgi:hypothetical protein